MTTKRRRGSGEGSIYYRKDRGRWYGSLDAGRDASGKRQRVLATGKTRKEVQDQLRELANEKADGILVSTPADLTLAGWLEVWLRDVVGGRVRASTHRYYEDLLALHVTPHVGGVRLRNFVAAHGTGLLARLDRAGKAPRLRQQVYTVLRTALRDAVKQGVLRRNPLEAVDRPQAPRAEVRALDVRQARALLAAVQGEPHEALFVLAITSGLRQGELFGLQWGDIDLNTATVRVRRTLVRDARTGRHSFAEPKTRAGRRTVELTTQAVEALRAHLQRLKATPHPARLVFADRRGRPLRRSNFLRRVWSPLLVAAGLPEVPFHALRHTAATLAIATGSDVKVVQRMLGHSSAALTLDTYADYLPQRGREVADRMAALLDAEKASG